MATQAISIFPSTQHLGEVEAMNERARTFVVSSDQQHGIPVAGLLSVDRILLNGVDVGLTSARPFMVEEPGMEPKTIKQEVSQFMLINHPDLGPVLIRSAFSNDGLWQKGLRVTIVGDWEETPGEKFISSIDVDAERQESENKLATANKEIQTKADENESLRKKLAETEKQLAEAKKAAAAPDAPATQPKPPNPPKPDNPGK